MSTWAGAYLIQIYYLLFKILMVLSKKTLKLPRFGVIFSKIFFSTAEGETLKLQRFGVIFSIFFFNWGAGGICCGIGGAPAGSLNFEKFWSTIWRKIKKKNDFGAKKVEKHDFFVNGCCCCSCSCCWPPGV